MTTRLDSTSVFLLLSCFIVVDLRNQLLTNSYVKVKSYTPTSLRDTRYIMDKSFLQILTFNEQALIHGRFYIKGTSSI